MLLDKRVRGVTGTAGVAAGLASLVLGLSACTTNSASTQTSTQTSVPSSSSAPVRRSSTLASTTSRPPATSAASIAPIPPLSAQAAAEGLLDIRTVIPDAVIDLRYATTNNFTHVRLYPKNARCLVHESMAPGLRIAAAHLRAMGDVLVFWDCYRPHAVQVRMFQVVPNPDWVARPGNYATSHESGRSVDVSLARAPTHVPCSTGVRIHGHCLLSMGTDFDDFSPRAFAYASDGVDARAQADRALLRNAMAAGGIAVYTGEWWHFDGPGALVRRPILGAPVQ